MIDNANSLRKTLPQGNYKVKKSQATLTVFGSGFLDLRDCTQGGGGKSGRRRAERGKGGAPRGGRGRPIPPLVNLRIFKQ